MDNVAEKIEQYIEEKDSRYKMEAYSFVRDALNYTMQKLNKNGHLSGEELLHGVREYGLLLYGPLTRNVFENWGIRSTDDFGEIVFNLIEMRIFNKKEEDTKEEFQGVYDFSEAFDSYMANLFNKGVK